MQVQDHWHHWEGWRVGCGKSERVWNDCRGVVFGIRGDHHHELGKTRMIALVNKRKKSFYSGVSGLIGHLQSHWDWGLSGEAWTENYSSGQFSHYPHWCWSSQQGNNTVMFCDCVHCSHPATLTVRISAVKMTHQHLKKGLQKKMNRSFCTQKDVFFVCVANKNPDAYVTVNYLYLLRKREEIRKVF